MDLNNPGILHIDKNLPPEWQKNKETPFKEITGGHVRIHGEELTIAKDLKQNRKILLIAFTSDHPGKNPKVIHGTQGEITERTYQVHQGIARDGTPFIQGFALLLPGETLVIPASGPEKTGQWEIKNIRGNTLKNWKKIQH